MYKCQMCDEVVVPGGLSYQDSVAIMQVHMLYHIALELKRIRVLTDPVPVLERNY